MVRGARGPAKLLFVEDDPMIQKLIRAALRATPHELHIASDGKEGLALAKSQKPDVIFSDVSMPGMDGFEMGDAVRADPDTADIPIVFMTASVQRAEIRASSLHGATGVLAKPFTMADLRARVEEFTSRR